MNRQFMMAFALAVTSSLAVADTKEPAATKPTADPIPATTHQLEVTEEKIEQATQPEVVPGAETGSVPVTPHQAQVLPNGNEALLVNLLLIEGHLRVAKELAEQENWQQAIPHFLHPEAEIIDKIGEDLKAHNMGFVKDDLEALAKQAIQKSNDEAFEQRYSTAMAHLDGAINDLTDNNPDTVLNAALALLKQAEAEYWAAFEGGQMINTTEYQDSRGFVWTAEELLRSAAAELQARNADAYQELMERFTNLRQGWPTVTAPAALVKTPSDISSDISEIEAILTKLRQV